MNKFQEVQEIVNNLAKIIGSINFEEDELDLRIAIELKKCKNSINEFVEKYHKPEIKLERRFDEILQSLKKIALTDIEQIYDYSKKNYLLIHVKQKDKLIPDSLLSQIIFGHSYKRGDGFVAAHSNIILQFHFDNVRMWIDEMLKIVNSEGYLDAIDTNNFFNRKKEFIESIGKTLEEAILLSNVSSVEIVKEIDHYDYKYALLKKFNPSWLNAEIGAEARWLEQLVAF